jgi:putative ATP-binding cassette transporter
VSRLSDRQVYVFDEFAADQDPGFRRYFYSELLPELKRQGKTVVAVTHDERWFEAGDRLVKLDYGMIATSGTVAGQPGTA